MQINSLTSPVTFGTFVHVSNALWLQSSSYAEKANQVKALVDRLAIPNLPKYGAAALDATCWLVSEDNTQALLAVNEPNGPQDASWVRRMITTQEWGSIIRFLVKKLFSKNVFSTDIAVIEFFKAEQQKAEKTNTSLRWQSVTDVSQVKPVN